MPSGFIQPARDSTITPTGAAFQLISRAACADYLANAGAILDDLDDGRYFRVSPCNRSSQSAAIAMLLYKASAVNAAEIFDITAEEVDEVVQRLNDRSDSVSNARRRF